MFESLAILCELAVQLEDMETDSLHIEAVDVETWNALRRAVKSDRHCDVVVEGSFF
jgi:hypothetical protein